MINFDIFMNEKMTIMKIINQYQTEVDGIFFCPLSQQKIADLVPCSKLKVNQVMKELIDNGYVIMLRKRGRYTTTKNAKMIIGMIQCDTQNCIKKENACDSEKRCFEQ